MNIDNYINYETEDFLNDESFVKWVLYNEKHQNDCWTNFLSQNPDKLVPVNEAILILKSIRFEEVEIPDERIKLIYKNLHPAQNIIGRKKNSFLKVAAIIILFVAIGGATFLFFHSKQQDIFVETNIANTEGKIILANGEIHEFKTENTNISQTLNGCLTINSDTIVKESAKSKVLTQKMNTIVLPYGKRLFLILSDGTKVWLNSGSTLSYPDSFSENSREVSLTGEAFFDVKHDASRPFNVVTKDLRITVLGTRFNISSYSCNLNTEAVLVSGKIIAGRNKIFSNKMELKPGERITFDRQNETVVRDQVDSKLFTSWIDGYLLLENEPLPQILKKLERYYNQEFRIDKKLEQIVFSGKLQLTDNVNKVIENLLYSTSYTAISEEGVITISL
jgi:hypothetical protein